MTEVNSFKNCVLGTFISHETSALDNTIVILLRIAMRLALRRPVLEKFICINIIQIHLHSFIIRMRPGEPMLAIYFSLIKRMLNACPRLEVIKRSVCIEGARRAFARAKVHWGKLDAEKLVKDGPPEGKAHRYPEKYYVGVMKGARLVDDECTKDTILE